MREPSPRPWRLVDGFECEIEDATGRHVLTAASKYAIPPLGDEREAANAALIVRAVNERDKLHSALQLVTHEMCKYCRAEAEKNPHLAGKPCLDGCEPMRLARAALAEDGQ